MCMLTRYADLHVLPWVYALPKQGALGPSPGPSGMKHEALLKLFRCLLSKRQEDDDPMWAKLMELSQQGRCLKECADAVDRQ